MKLEEKNGFSFLEGQLVFSIDPDDIVWRMREDWLGFIEKGHNVFLETIVPYFEREAISRFEKEWTIPKEGRPKIQDGYEDWRYWWLNEASHNCDSHSPIGTAGQHLTPLGRIAVNILMTASALRDALESNKAQEAAGLAMLLVCEGIAGGYSLKFEAVKTAKELGEQVRVDVYKKSIGAEAEDHKRARHACIRKAKEIWASDSERRIGAVAEELRMLLHANFDQLPSLDKVPDLDTIKGWLKAAAKAGKLVIPEAARKGGRPLKQKK